MNEKTRNRLWNWSLIGLFGAAGGYRLCRKRCIPAVMTLCAGVLLSLGAFYLASDRDVKTIEADFRDAAGDRAEVVKSVINSMVSAVESLRAFYNASENVEPHEFAEFAKPSLHHLGATQTLVWAPCISDNQRAPWEAATRRESLKAFQITERNAQGRVIAASRRAEYFPVVLVEPFRGNEAFLGMDLASDPSWRDALRRSCDSGEPVPIRVTSPEERVGQQGYLLVVLPVYKKGLPILSIEDRQNGLKGFVAGYFHLEGMFKNASSGWRPTGIDICLYNALAPASRDLVWFHASPLHEEFSESIETDHTRDPKSLHYRTTVEVGNQRWSIWCAPMQRFLAARQTWWPWIALAFGLMMTGLLTTHLLTQVGQAVRVNRLVDERTARLQESESCFRSVTTSAQDAIIMIDPQSRISLWNRSAERVFGYSAEEAMGRHLHKLLAPARLHEAYEMGFAEFVRSGEGAAMGKILELPALHKDGHEFPVELSVAPVRLHAGWHAVGIVRDTSQLKITRDREARSLQRLEGVNQLRENLLLPGSPEDKFKRITETAVELLDLDFCRIWTVKPSDLCEAGCIHSGVTEGPHVCRDRQRCLHLVSSSGRYVHIDGDHRRVPFGAYKIGRIASGQDRSFLTNAATTDSRVHNHDWARSLGLVSFAGYKLRDGNGGPIGVLAMFAKHPISEEDDAFLCNLAETTSKVIQDAEVQAELREKTTQALQATHAKSEFLANMSHEIRTPMTSILGYTDLLMDDSLNAADRKTFLMIVRRNAEHLLQLINDILDLSKVESGKMVMDFGPCRLPTTIAEVASTMRPRAEQRRNRLEVRYAGSLPETIHTDGARLRQVLVNLVGNAVKFTEGGSIRIGVSFLPHWRPDQSAVSVEVTDTGIGISQEAMPNLFQPFTQAESSTTRKYGGTGLGLAISRQIVTALSGELTVRSAPGEGSTFAVTIPTGDLSRVNLLESPGEVICEHDVGTRWTPGADLLQGVKILLAEDSIDNQELLRIVLGDAGAEVEVVENGRQAVDRASQDSFDVVLMDMNMPEMDGYEATERLRDRGYSRPILALTANSMSGDCEHCLAAGCNAHLAKPIDRKRLIETVAKYVVSKCTQTDASMASPDRAAGPGRSDGVVSRFADDPAFTTILPGFIERLPNQLDALCKAMEEERLEDAERIAHRLKGTGGSYGYPILSEVARSLELATKSQNVDEAAAALAGLKEVVAAIQTGWTR